MRHRDARQVEHLGEAEGIAAGPGLVGEAHEVEAGEAETLGQDLGEAVKEHLRSGVVPSHHLQPGFAVEVLAGEEALE